MLVNFCFFSSNNKSNSSKTNVKSNKNENKKTSAESVNIKTENELLDLIPKSIDEEEIMLKKALELSLKYSEETKVKEYVG